ncbi:hypothetical protein IP90_03001 [Luteimonas cucumeris]|uniref:Proline hydroxylase n=1 Tax=Luteimonas cucumeris TaxID=985012 RepID=A0A562KX99_9GAMM|nr:hypothetical protein IP90_03001 [Luteimonas cucumeris]
MTPASHAIGTRLDAQDWQQAGADLDARGNAVLPRLLAPDICERLADGYDDASLYRSRVVMERHGFGRGEYRYFAYPLPAPVAGLRAGLYPYLAPIANRWQQAMGRDIRYPPRHDEFIARCHRAGQTRPTPLLLRYGADDYNCLHQDLYGEHVFPLQVAILLSQPGRDFTGGEFVLTEQRRAGRHGRRSCRCCRATPWCSPCVSGPCAARAATTASICATASAACVAAGAIRSA